MFTETEKQRLLDLLERLIEAMEAPDKLPPMQGIVRIFRESLLTAVDPPYLVTQLGVVDGLLRIADSGRDIADAIGHIAQAVRQLTATTQLVHEAPELPGRAPRFTPE